MSTQRQGGTTWTRARAMCARQPRHRGGGEEQAAAGCGTHMVHVLYVAQYKGRVERERNRMIFVRYEDKQEEMDARRPNSPPIMNCKQHPAPHMRNTPNPPLSSGGGASRRTIPSARPSASRVSRGRSRPSSHRRAVACSAALSASMRASRLACCAGSLCARVSGALCEREGEGRTWTRSPSPARAGRRP
jgi:hypothetical protein